MLCPRQCQIFPEQTGFCLNRKNNHGKLFSLNYGKVAALRIDPIEKKPLHHFYPGSLILSAGTYGCSLDCDFCQNASIARQTISEKGETLFPGELVNAAMKSGVRLLAYTYNEPWIWYEQVLETAQRAREHQILNVLVTNGFYQREPWEKLAPFIDAINLDLKGNEEFYKKNCKAFLFPILETLRSAVEKGIHVEVTTLVVTGKNDSPAFFHWLTETLAQISPRIPLHISKYFPGYRSFAPPTEDRTLLEFYETARSQLDFVYLGNVAASFPGQNTDCPHCAHRLIQRKGYQVQICSEFQNGVCPQCGSKIYGRF